MVIKFRFIWLESRIYIISLKRFKIINIKIKLIKEIPDGTKQYSIIAKGDKDIRKDVFATFAKNGITIFELKKAEISLEDAFIDLIDNQKEESKKEENVKTKEEIKKEKQEQKENKKKQKELKKTENKKEKGGDK